MVAALRPEEFLAGARDCGAELPHAQLAISSAGQVCVRGESLFRGYYPDWRQEGPFETDDLGHFDARGHLSIEGRRDAAIISGGKKIAPGEVEAALRATGQFRDVAVIGVPDREWGEIVVACFPDGQSASSLEAVETALRAHLAPHKLPKRYVAVDPWPRNTQGKVNRAALREKLIAQSTVPPTTGS